MQCACCVHRLEVWCAGRVGVGQGKWVTCDRGRPWLVGRAGATGGVLAWCMGWHAVGSGWCRPGSVGRTSGHGRGTGHGRA